MVHFPRWTQKELALQLSHQEDVRQDTVRRPQGKPASASMHSKYQSPAVRGHTTSTQATYCPGQPEDQRGEEKQCPQSSLQYLMKLLSSLLTQSIFSLLLLLSIFDWYLHFPEISTICSGLVCLSLLTDYPFQIDTNILPPQLMLFRTSLNK